MKIAKRTLRNQLINLCGTPRRFLLSVFRRGYVRRSLAQRQGSCLRCGACCQLVVKCIYYFEDKGLPSCRLYGIFRMPNCSAFPFDQRDINDRNRVAPETPCGYSWPAKK